MKQSALFFLLFLSIGFSFAQKLPYVGPGQTFVFPSAVNQFVNAGNIAWALDMEEAISFADAKKIENENIFNYLILKALPGSIKDNINGTDLRDKEFEGYEHNMYGEYGIFSRKGLGDNQIDLILSDSSKTINFHEVFYLKDYALRSKILAAGPMTHYATSSGINLGMREIFYCCKNINDTASVQENKNILPVKRIVRVLHFDSIKYAKVIKQTYGLNAVQSIWHGATQGTVKLFDLEKKQVILPQHVLNYPCQEPEKKPRYDTKGNLIGYDVVEGSAVFPYRLENMIQFTQDFYYDRNWNIFLTTISDCYLFVNKWNTNTQQMQIEKRFRIIE